MKEKTILFLFIVICFVIRVQSTTILAYNCNDKDVEIARYDSKDIEICQKETSDIIVKKSLVQILQEKS